MHHFGTNKYRVCYTGSSSLIFGLISCTTFKYAWSVHWISSQSLCLVSDWHMASLVSALSFTCLHCFNIIFLHNWKDSLWCHFACCQLLTSLFYHKGIDKGCRLCIQGHWIWKLDSFLHFPLPNTWLTLGPSQTVTSMSPWKHISQLEALQHLNDCCL